MSHAVEKTEEGWKALDDELRQSGVVFLVNWSRVENALRGKGPELIAPDERVVSIRSTSEGLYFNVESSDDSVD